MPDVEGDKPKRSTFKRSPPGFFPIDLAEIRTAEGKLVPFVGIDPASNFAATRRVEKADGKTAWEVLQHMLAVVPCRVHTVLTDTGIPFAKQPRNVVQSRPMRFDMICEANGIEHRLTRPNPPRTNCQVERMNRTIKEATVKRSHSGSHCDSHDPLRTHLADFMAARNFARRLKTLGGCTPSEYICKIWTTEPDRSILNPIQQMPGLTSQASDQPRPVVRAALSPGPSDRSATMSSDPLLQPYRLKHLTLRNRIMITSHEPAYPEDGMPKDRYRAYHVERARAGVALTMTAGSAAVSRDSPPVFNNILAWKDEVVGWMRKLADECHDHGCAVMIQLTHLGRRTRWDKGDWLPVVSPGHEREAAHRAFPKKLEDWDIVRIIGDYADAAERMQAAGLDGIELEAYGHLMDQFWSPLTNQMDAPYGGDLDNRLRFAFEVLTEIRKRCGPDFIVGLRYSGDEGLAGGLTSEDGLAISRRLRDSGMVDFLNVVRGHIDTDAGLTDVIPIQGMASAPHLDFAGRIRRETDFPTFHAARIPDVATARHAIAAGLLDMVGMTRAHMADPHLVRKIVEGREDDIRPCVGANYCLDRIYQGGMAFCIHNPATGREQTLPHDIPPASRKRRVTIVGAGPAGMEAARVAAERGHEVTVFEAADRPGGQIRLTARQARRREMMAIIDWRLAQCERRGVRFRFNTLADEQEVRDSRPDTVIIATGGLPHTEVLAEGNDLVCSAWDILSGDVKPGQNVLIFDDAGDHAALQAADLVAASGASVEVVTPDRSFAPEVMAMNLVPYVRNLQPRDVTFTVTWRLISVTREGNQLRATLGSDYGPVTRDRLVDQVVVNHGTRPLDDLYFALKPLSSNLGEVDYEALTGGRPQAVIRNPEGQFRLFRIGDAVAARNTHAAIHDALRLLKDL